MIPLYNGINIILDYKCQINLLVYLWSNTTLFSYIIVKPIFKSYIIYGLKPTLFSYIIVKPTLKSYIIYGLK